MSQILGRLEIPPYIAAARLRLKRVYGCLAGAVQYLHENDIRHKDLKPRNILPDRKDGLFVTDFGISRDCTDASTSVTNGIERGTYKYCAPEVARYEPRGRAADIYSLGCVFLEMTTVYHRLSLVEFDNFRREKEDLSFQNCPAKLREWMTRLRQVKFAEDVGHGIFDIINIIEKMLVETATDRLVIGVVRSSLQTLHGQSYFGLCCQTQHPRVELLEAENYLLRKVLGFTNSLRCFLTNTISLSRDKIL